MNCIINKAECFVQNVDKKYNIKFAYIFGSQASGKSTDVSDIDIALYFKKKNSAIEDAYIRGEIIEEGKTFFKKDVDILSLDNAPLLLRYEVIQQGIVIKDHSERADFESLTLREYFDFKYYSDIYDKAMIERIKKGEFFGGINNG